MKILRKFRNIIIGNINNIFNLNKEVSNPRMDIWNRCEYAMEILKLGQICTQCGCILKAKTTVKEEHCVLNKW